MTVSNVVSVCSFASAPRLWILRPSLSNSSAPSSYLPLSDTAPSPHTTPFTWLAAASHMTMADLFRALTNYLKSTKYLNGSSTLRPLNLYSPSLFWAQHQWHVPQTVAQEERPMSVDTIVLLIILCPAAFFQLEGVFLHYWRQSSGAPAACAWGCFPRNERSTSLIFGQDYAWSQLPH